MRWSKNLFRIYYGWWFRIPKGPPFGRFWNLEKNGMFTISTGARRISEPSTVLRDPWSKYPSFSNHQSFFAGRMAMVRAWFHDISWHETPIWRQCWWIVSVSRDLFSASNTSNWLGVVKHVGVSFKMMLHFVFQNLACCEHNQMKAAAPAPSWNKWKSNNKNWKKTLSQKTWKVCCWSRSTAYYFQPDLNMLRFFEFVW